MKKIFQPLLFTGILVFLFCACKKDEVKSELSMPGSIPGFTSSASQLVLSTANDSSSVVTFKWQSPNYGFAAALTYTLYFDVPSDTSGANAWANAVKVTVPVKG